MGLRPSSKTQRKIARTHQANDLRNCLLDEKQVRLKGNELTKCFYAGKNFSFRRSASTASRRTCPALPFATNPCTHAFLASSTTFTPPCIVKNKIGTPGRSRLISRAAKPPKTGMLNVENHQIWFQLAGHFNGLLAILGLRANFNITTRSQNRAHTSSNGLVVIGY
jgi:hypothetical protein